MFRPAIFVSLLVAVAAPPSVAETKAIGRYKEWRVYTEGSGSSMVCFAATPAEDAAPKNLQHGDVNFYVATWKSRPSASQSSLRVGYDLRGDLAPEAVIGSERFKMYASGPEAFVPDNRESALLAALQKGSELRVEAAAVGKGRAAYHFSLQGSRDAIDKARSLCR